jgi:predicted Zn-dependent peptidase
MFEALALTVLLAAPGGPQVWHLDNGLEVAFLPDRTTPLVAFLGGVRAGRVHEPEGAEGSTHFLEHLLFGGTETRSQKEIYSLVDRMGAWSNAATRADHTIFMLLVPAEHLEEAASLQADMLFRSTLSPERVEAERGIVREEIGRMQDQEMHRVGVVLDALAYQGSPLAIPVLGTPETIAALPRDTVWRYYRERYVARNTSLLILGNAESEEVRRVVEKHYGTAPAGSPPPYRFDLPDFPEGGVWMTAPEQASEVRMKVVLPAPAAGSDEEPAAWIFTELWNAGAFTGGEDPPMSAVYDPLLGGGFLELHGKPGPEGDPTLTLARAVDALRGAGEVELSPGAVDRAVKGARREEAAVLEKPHYFGMFRSALLAGRGAEGAIRWLSTLEGTTLEEVAATADRFASAPYRAAAVGPDLDTGTTQPATPRLLAYLKEKAPEPARAAASPSAGPSPGGFVRQVLPNGLTVLIEERPSTGVFAAYTLARERTAHEMGGIDGLADVTHRLLLEGTTHRSAEEIRVAIAELAAAVKVTDDPRIPYDDYETRTDFTFLRYEGLAEDAGPGLLFLADVLLHPTFPDQALAETTQKAVASATRRQGSARNRAKRLLVEALFPGTPTARSPLGTPEGVQRITRPALEQFYGRHFAPSNLILAVVSPVPAEQLLPTIRQLFGDGPPAGPRPAPQCAAHGPGRTRSAQRVEEAGGGMQGVLRIGRRLDLPDEDRPALLAATAVLSDRLGMEVRERRGLAYSVGAALPRGECGSWFTVGLGTRPQALEEAEEAVREEIRRIRTRGVRPDELERAVNSFLAGEARRNLSSIGRAGRLALWEMYGEGPEAELARAEAMRALTPKDVKEALKAHLSGDEFVTVVVR